MITLISRLKSRKKTAFTLIELLVVISIIALLLSILMQAFTVVCASNFKQWNIILSLLMIIMIGFQMPIIMMTMHIWLGLDEIKEIACVDRMVLENVF